MKTVKFILLQASVVFDRQISMFEGEYEDTKEGRNLAFRNVVEKLIENKMIKVNPRFTEYVLLYKVKISDNLIYCQLAKKTKISTYDLKDDDIKEEPRDSYPPLDVFINMQKQQFAVQLNNAVLTENAIQTNITKLINSLAKGFSIFINTVQNERRFWDLIGETDLVQEISFDLIAPNFFNASGAANDLVAGAREELNADSVLISFKNKKGGLQAKLQAIDAYVNYSSSAGSWKLKIKERGKGRYKTIKSTDYCDKKEIETEILELLKKIDDNGQLGTEIYYGVVERLYGLFEDEN